jgi:ADP-ribosylglycohydrolase
MEPDRLEQTPLFDKIYAAMLAGAIGDAMGGPVEGWHYREIVERHGVVDELLEYDDPPDYHSHFSTEAGSYTDDTRLKHVLCRAILDREGLPRRGDLVEGCIDAYYGAETDLERGFLEEYVLAGIYGEDKLIWGGQPTNGFIMMNSPLGLICPGDPKRAFELSYDVDFISDGYAKYSSAIAAAAVAAAMDPGATVESVVDRALSACQTHRIEGELTRRWNWYDHVFQINERLVRTAVDIAATHHSVFDVRSEYYEALQVGPLGSEAGQTLAVALGMLVAANGDLEQAIIGCVNYGRDNDSYATLAGAIAGAMHGIKAIPRRWRETVEAANPQPALNQLSRGLAKAVLARHREMEAVVESVAQLSQSRGERPQ